MHGGKSGARSISGKIRGGVAVLACVLALSPYAFARQDSKPASGDKKTNQFVHPQKPIAQPSSPTPSVPPPGAKPDLKCEIRVEAKGKVSGCGLGNDKPFTQKSIPPQSEVFTNYKINCGVMQGLGLEVAGAGSPSHDGVGWLKYEEFRWIFTAANAGNGPTADGKKIKVSRSITMPGHVTTLPQVTLPGMSAGARTDQFTPAGVDSVSVDPVQTKSGPYKADISVEYDGDELNNNKGNNVCSHSFTLRNTGM